MKLYILGIALALASCGEDDSETNAAKQCATVEMAKLVASDFEEGLEMERPTIDLSECVADEGDE